MRRAAVFFATWLAAATSWGHQSSVSYSQVDIAEAGAVAWTLRLSSRDLYEALGLDRERDATDDEIHTGSARLIAYVHSRLAVTNDSQPCPLTSGAVSILHQQMRFVELRFDAHCDAPLGTIALESHLFFDLDARHSGLARITRQGASVTREFTQAHPRLELSAEGTGLGLGDYVVKGMEHIYSGTDHIAFVIGLLLVAALHDRRARSFAAAIPYVVKVVTAFTIAHSTTLILAALNVFDLPSRWVESAIAASIVFIAVENIVVAEPRNRWPLAFLFGLVHGLGFAAMLRPLLPQSDVVVPLLAFNVGVELGQLSIVVVLLPLLVHIARWNATAYRRIVVLGGSGLIGLLGCVWLIERALG